MSIRARPCSGIASDTRPCSNIRDCGTDVKKKKKGEVGYKIQSDNSYLSGGAGGARGRRSWNAKRGVYTGRLRAASPWTRRSAADTRDNPSPYPVLLSIGQRAFTTRMATDSPRWTVANCRRRRHRRRRRRRRRCTQSVAQPRTRGP